MVSDQNPKPFHVPPTSGQIKTGFWLGVVVSGAFWCMFVFIVLDRGWNQSLLALVLPILVTGGTVFSYFKHRKVLRAERSA